jgi:hypothetical protein
MLHAHRHEVELIPESGPSVSATVEKLRRFNKELVPKCWANICSHNVGDKPFEYISVGARGAGSLRTRGEGPDA